MNRLNAMTFEEMEEAYEDGSLGSMKSSTRRSLRYGVMNTSLKVIQTSSLRVNEFHHPLA